MKHQREITGQRLVNMKNGITTTEQHIETVKAMVNNINNLEKDNNYVMNAVIEIKDELEEIADFLAWIKQQ